MNRFRWLMMVASLFLGAASANAQSLSATAVQSLREGTRGCCPSSVQIFHAVPVAGQVVPLNWIQVQGNGQFRVEPSVVVPAGMPGCPSACEASWLTQAKVHGAAVLQRVRAICVTNKESTCCEAAAAASGQANRIVCKEAAECVAGAAGTAKAAPAVSTTVQSGKIVVGIGIAGAGMQCPLVGSSSSCCPLAQLLKLACPVGVTAQKASAPCCCAKACACCETCKAKPAISAQILPKPSTPAVTWTHPAPVQAGQAWSLPVPPPAGSRVVVALPPAHHAGAKPVHLVTPDLEAHCQRILHRDGQIILEGDVLLLCTKNAQPIRIEAQRVLINPKDGTFTVESTRGTALPPLPTGFGTLRMSNIGSPTVEVFYPPVHRETIQIIPVSNMAPETPARVIELPVNARPR